MTVPARRLAILLVAAGFLLTGAAAGIVFLVAHTQVSPEAIRSSVIRGEAVARAWTLPAAATFRRDVAWQSNASLCGPASLANVFRSFGEMPVTESGVLADTGLCWTGFCLLGLTLDELADVARSKTRRSVTVIRDITPEEFRAHLRKSNDPSRRYVINFDRKVIFGSGAGHHSPIGGYLEDEDLVFVLDTNREYQPWLVERSRLFGAMNTLDGSRTRGMLLIE